MKVKELIEVLSLMDPEAIVVVPDMDGDFVKSLAVDAVTDADIWDTADGWTRGADVVSITSK